MTDLTEVSVLVTGATGFVGSRLVAQLRANGARVTALSRDPDSAERLLGVPAIAVSGMDRVAESAPRVVVNLAGAGIADRPWTRRRRRVLMDSRVAFTHALHDALRQAPPEVLVNASAVGFYGTHEDRAFVEEDGPGTGFAAELCAAWEAAAEAFAADGTRVVRLRFGLVLGPGGLLVRLKVPFSLGLGGRIGHGRQWMSWIHRDDVTGFIERAITDDALEGPFNATAPEPARNAAFTRALGRVLGRPTPFPVPGFLLRAALGEMADELLLSGARVLPRRAEGMGFPFRHPELDGALRDALGRGRGAPAG